MFRIGGILWICLGYCIAGAQAQVSLSGKITDSTGKGLSFASIQFFSATDTASLLAREDGTFSLRLPPQRLTMEISMKGYRSIRIPVNLSENIWPVRLKPVMLRTDYRELEPVVVSGVRPITMTEDTLSYHVAAFPMRAGAAVEDVLKRLPGIEVDINGNVIVQGKIIGKVMVDGKDFFGGDVLTATRNLPADIVDKLEVIDDYGDKARLTGVKSGDAAKVLNIVLKKDTHNGEFGQAEGGMGQQGKYLASAFANSFKGERQLSVNAGLSNNSPAGTVHAGNASLHYADRWNKKWSGYGSLSFNRDNHESQSNLVQDNDLGSSQIHMEQVSHTSGKNQNTSFGYTMLDKPSPYSSLRISPSSNLQQTSQTNSGQLYTHELDSGGFTKITNGSSLNTSTSQIKTLGVDVYFERLYPNSKRRWTVQANMSYSSNNQPGRSQSSTLTRSDSVSGNSQQNYLLNNRSSLWNLGANMNYYAPIGKASFLELGYVFSSYLNSNNKVTRAADSINPNPLLIDSLSNDFHFQSILHRVHAGYISHFKKMDLSLGLDVQPGMLIGQTPSKFLDQHYQYLNLLPSLQASYNLTKNKRLLLNYSSRSTQPTLQQLQPVTDLSNPQYPVTGNPDLKPAFNQSVGAHYEQSSLKPTQYYGFGLGLGYNTTQNMVITNLIHPHDASGVVQRTIYLNADGFHSLHADYHVTLPAFLHKRLHLTLGGNVNSNRSITITDSIPYATNTLAWGQEIHISLLIPDVIESDLQGGYTRSLTHFNTQPAASPSSSANYAFSSKHYFFRKWMLNYTLSQTFTSGIGGRLESNQVLFSAVLQRQFLPENRATINLTGYNLLNGATGASQSITATSITRMQTALTARYFLLSFLLKLQHFR